MQSIEAVPAAIVAPVEVRGVVRVQLTPPAPRGRFRWEVETAGMVTALLELGLGELRDVVVEVPGVPVAPGMAEALATDAETWTARVELDGDPTAMVVRLILCPSPASQASPPSPASPASPVAPAALVGHSAPVAEAPDEGACHTIEQTAAREQVQLAMPGLLGAAAVRLGAEPAPGAAEQWGASLSADDYAVLVAGRAAATWYGLRAAVPEAHKGDRMRDPVTRAVFIDPSVAVSQWVSGRRAAADGEWARARVAFTAASLGRAASPVLRADEAAALTKLGVRQASSAAWDALVERHPDDRRYLLPQATAALAADRIEHASDLVEALAPRFGREPEVAELRVRVADRSGRPADPDGLLYAWQQADLENPEPARRRVYLRIRRRQLEDALELLPELARRGAAAEADQLRMALAVGLGRWDVASGAARALGDPATAARIEGRGALEAGGALPEALLTDGDLDVRLVVGEVLLARGAPSAEAAQALDHARAVRRVDPYRPEAMALEIRALRAMGREAEAVKAEQGLRAVEPAP